MNGVMKNVLISIGVVLTSLLVINFVMSGFCSLLVILLLFSLTCFLMEILVRNNIDFPNVWFAERQSIGDNIYLDRIAKRGDFASVCLVCGDINCKRHDSRLSLNCQPWKGLMIDKEIDSALQEILELTLNEFVNKWYEQIASDEPTLDHELRHILRAIISSLLKRCKKIDIIELILKKLPKILSHHLEMFVYGKRRSKSAQHVEECVLLEYSHLLHPALVSREEELKWLTKIVESIMPFMLSPKYLKSQVVHSFFRELLSCCVLLPIIDVCGDPDKINSLLILLFDNTSVYKNEKSNTEMVEILERFASIKVRPQTNNVGIELKKILSDQQFLFLFTQFAKEEDFINLVQFILHMNTFSQKILNPDLTQQQLKELHFESVNIFNCYFKHDSIDCINFSDDIYNGFKDIITRNFEDVEKLRTTEPLYHSYDYVYNLLETYYCPLFFQSDVYFKLICGQRWASFDNVNHSVVKIEYKSQSNIQTVDSCDLPNISTRFDDINNESMDYADDVASTYQEYDRLSQFETIDEASNVDRLKDLSAWRVSIPQIDSRVDANGKDYEVFVIEVQRLDVQQNDTIESSWDVERRYNEFYVLESKLKEFHGEKLSGICLPPKKSFVKLSKTFMESKRQEFEKFLKQLLTSSQLRGSELVSNFLNQSSEEFTTGFLPDIKIGKMIKTVPAKFSKERGQHLEPFLVSLISSTERLRPKPYKNEISELLEYSPTEFSMNNIKGSLYRDNMAQWKDKLDNVCQKENTNRDRVRAHLEYAYDYIMFFLIRFYNLNNCFLKILLLLRPLVRKTLQSFCEWYISVKFRKSLLISPRIVDAIHVLRDVLFFEKDIPLRTSQQKKQRSQLALKYTKEFFPNWFIDNILDKDRHEEVVYLLFSIFQYPLLNKQFLYLSFDVILEELFPEILYNNAL